MTVTTSPVQRIWRPGDDNVPVGVPLCPGPEDQGDPQLEWDPQGKEWIIVTTGDPENGKALHRYVASPDFRTCERIDNPLLAEERAHWAPVLIRQDRLGSPYPPGQAWALIYSRSAGLVGSKVHEGHEIRAAFARRPTDTFLDRGIALATGNPEERHLRGANFAIDAAVYEDKGRLMLGYSADIVGSYPRGTALFEVELARNLWGTLGTPRLLARPSFAACYYFRKGRRMPWKEIPGVDTAISRIRWRTMEAVEANVVHMGPGMIRLRNPEEKRVWLFSGGCYEKFYFVGALIEEEGRLVDTVTEAGHFVVKPTSGIYGPGHPSIVQLDDGRLYLLLHARFGSPTAPRQMCLLPLLWNERGWPYCSVPSSWIN